MPLTFQERILSEPDAGAEREWGVLVAMPAEREGCCGEIEAWVGERRRRLSGGGLMDGGRERGIVEWGRLCASPCDQLVRDWIFQKIFKYLRSRCRSLVSIRAY